MPHIPNNFGTYHRLDLSNNSIGTLHSHAFRGLNQLRDLDLSDNHLTTIDRHAFADIANITRLSIASNQLTSLPDALNDLSNLEALDVTDNPIPPDTHIGFKNDIMRHLGGKLKEFHFGDDIITTWPQSTNHLQALEILDLNGGNIGYIPPFFTDGFRSRLRSLTIRNTRLPTTPILTGLRSLKELHLDNNPFHDYGVLENSFTGLDALETLSLNSDLLTKFPPILQHLPNLVSVALDGNSFYYISDNAITLIHGTNITELSLRDCNLDRVPGALTGNTLYQLTKIDLSNNNINSIERYDLDGLHNIRNLSMSNNPLQYVSSHALNLTSLQFLDLSNTQLTTVPKAIQNIPNLRKLNLGNNEIDCTCDLIWFQKLVNPQHATLNLTGSCETIDRTVLEYLAQFIPKCPDYLSSLSLSNPTK
ncbi:leucine-rich repeat-containing protein 40-like [Saccostrea echinata]|uniref:leucine-rich repeat-containing protein 40-like n=1 Tax=Saccostrea echinata TaxID=191078 RepID=UPI002A80D30E|nr:leucine-rich repeat-containing protein 40-like [Saccostrea echinata]